MESADERPAFSAAMAAADAAAHPHVDGELLDEVLTVLGGDLPAGLLRACDLFRSGVPARIDDAKAALAEHDLDQVARSAHSLRGSAGSFGALRLSVLADHLETLCRHGDAAGAGVLLDEMQAEFSVFRTILDARIAEITG